MNFNLENKLNTYKNLQTISITTIYHHDHLYLLYLFLVAQRRVNCFPDIAVIYGRVAGRVVI